jgi:hypothetical protein
MKPNSFPYQDDFLQLRLYKIKTTQVSTKTLKIQKTKRLLIPLLLLLLTVAIFDSHALNDKYISAQELAQFYKMTLNKGFRDLLLDALEDHSNHFFKVLEFVNAPDDQTFMRVLRNKLTMDISWENTDTLRFHKMSLSFALKKNFNKENAQQKLNLPFSLSDLKDFGIFFSDVLNLKVYLSGLIFCIESPHSMTTNCYESRISLKYINRNNVVISKIQSTLTEGFLKNQYAYTLNHPFNVIFKSRVSEMGYIFTDISTEKSIRLDLTLVINIAILLITVVLLVIDSLLYYLFVHRKKMEKHFRMAKMIYQEQYGIDFSTFDKLNKPQMVNVSFVLCFIGNLCLFFFFLNKLIIGLLTDNVTEFHTSYISSFYKPHK